MIAWSHSRLMDFEACPLMFREKHVVKSIKFEPNDNMKRGTERHKMLEREVIRATYKDEPAVPEVAHVWPIIKSFTSAHQEVIVEEQLCFTKSLKSVDWFHKDAWLRIKMDVIGRVNPYSKLSDQTVNIIDWKTGQYDVNDDQLKLYNLGAFLKWQYTMDVSSVLVFVDQQRTSPIYKSNRVWDMQNLLNEFCDRSEAIQIAEERDTWPAQPNRKCRWCGIMSCNYRGTR